MEDTRAKSVKIRREPQLIHEDEATGATAHLYELETIVPTAPARFEDLEKSEGLYFYRKLGAGEEPEFVAARPAFVHTDPEIGESYQTFAVSRPSGTNLFYLNESELAARYRLVPKGAAKNWWSGEVEKIPPYLTKTVFLLSGALIPVWRQIKNVKDQALKIVRTTTDEGVRLVGLQIPKASVKEIARLFDCSWRTDESLAEIYENVICGKESLGLAETVRLKAAKVFSDFYVEILPGYSTHPKKFRSFGLTSITVNYRERFFLPQEASAAINLLQKLVSHFPPVVTNTDIQSVKQQGWRVGAYTNIEMQSLFEMWDEQEDKVI